MLVMLLLITELITLVALPLPLLVMVPVVLTAPAETVMTPALVEFSVTLPVPAIPPVMFSTDVPLSVNIVLLAPLVIRPLTPMVEVLLLCVMPVTLAFTAEATLTAPAPVPVSLIVPILLMAPVFHVTVPVDAGASSRLPVPVTAPCMMTLLAP